MSHILVIDDEEKVGALLCRFLERGEHTTAVARNGKEGLRLYLENPADLVIVDIFMPDMDGLEVIRTLRKETPECRVIAISGGGQMGMPDFLPTARKLGAQHVLKKPIRGEELLAIVGEMLAN